MSESPRGGATLAPVGDAQKGSDAWVVRISKLLALALRHDPSALGITLDAQGFAELDAVLEGLARTGLVTSRDELEDLVATSDASRFALSPDGDRIRATHGHSIEVDLGLSPAEPPEVLLHGTSMRFARAIARDGLVRGARTHVHLAADERVALRVAQRRAGPHALFAVRARDMHGEGHVFVQSEGGVWLVDHVPPPFLTQAAWDHEGGR